ncbi:MAG: hypothetical protein GY896_18645 [Gammaproteobacteria bacterium]|nr:hypothetical protein [Gammaproteobacteria bacterium]
MKRLSLTLLLLTALAPGLGFTQTELSEIIPRYDVEIVVFKNLQVPKSREFVLPVSSPGRGEKYLDLSSSSSLAAAAKLGYEILPSDQFRLLESVAKLVESTRYELLLHVAWRQPGLELERVLPVWIRGGRIYGNEYTSIDSQIDLIESIPKVGGGDQAESKVYEFDEQTLESLELQLMQRQNAPSHQGLYEFEGKITIALSRYLHTYTDLVLRRPRLSADPVLNNSAKDILLATASADTRILNNHRLKEHRRMRSKTLHYLDNPEFAMLILITPFEVAKDFQEEPVEAEAAASE